MKKGKITIDNFSGGWSNDFAKSSTISAIGTSPNTYYSGFFNPNLANYLGQVTRPFGGNPNLQATDSLPINAARTSNDGAHFICTDGTLPEMSVNGVWPPGRTNWSAPAGCTNDNFKDIWTHIAPNTATTPLGEAVLYTWQDATTVYLGYKYSSTATGRNDTYYSFGITNRNKPHVGCVSVNNRSYITDGNWVRVFIPLTGVGTGINIGSGYTCKSVCDYGDYVAIVGDDGKNARMWLWDGAAEFANFQYEIRDTYATAIINEGGSLRVFTYGKNNTTKIKTFAGSGFSEEADWEVPTSFTECPAHNMVDLWLNQIVWKTQNNIFWTYGSPRKNELGTGANRVGRLDSGYPSGSGCVRNLYQDRLFVGAGANVHEVLGTNPYGGLENLVIKTNLYTLPHKSNIECIHLFFSRLNIVNANETSGITVNLYSGYNTTDLLGAATIPLNSTAINLDYYPIRITIPKIDTFYIVLTQANSNVTTALKKIEIDYTYEGSAI